MRTRAERRKLNIKKSIRKQKLSKTLFHHSDDKLHKYSKNKIHCSCPMCSGMDKTNQKKFKGKGHGQCSQRYGTTNQRKGKNWKISDYRKIMSMEEDLNLEI